LRLDRLTARHSGDTQSPTIPGPVEALRAPFAATLLARPRGERAPISADALALPAPDPLRELRKQLERAYLTRVTVRPRQVLRFLERRVPPFGSTEARYLRIENLDDFLAFETLRLAMRGVARGDLDDLLARRLAEHFHFEPALSGGVDNEWLTCENFRIHRRSDHVSLEVDLAD
jgi:hypothetical protein